MRAAADAGGGGGLLVPSLPSLLPLSPLLAFGAALLLSLGVGVREEGSPLGIRGAEAREGHMECPTGMEARLMASLGWSGARQAGTAEGSVWCVCTLCTHVVCGRVCVCVCMYVGVYGV